MEQLNLSLHFLPHFPTGSIRSVDRRGEPSRLPEGANEVVKSMGFYVRQGQIQTSCLPLAL